MNNTEIVWKLKKGIKW